METIMPCVIGVFVGLAVWMTPRLQREPGVQRESPCLRCASALTELLAATHVLDLRLFQLMVEEATRIHVRGKKLPYVYDPLAFPGVVVFAWVSCAVLAVVLAGSVVAAGAVGIGLPGAVVIAHNRRQRQRERVLEEEMPEAFSALALSLESGYSLPQALQYVGLHAREPVRGEFMRVASLLECGTAPREALDAMLERLDAPGLSLVGTALNISQRTGAPLKDVLADASLVVGERIELRRRLEVKTSQARMSAKIIAGMPVAMTILLMLLSSDFREGITLPAGAFSLLGAMGLNITAWMFIKKILDIEL